MTTFWIVVGMIVVAALVAMLVHDRRAGARGAALHGGASDGVRGTAVTGDPEAYRSSPGSHPNGWGGGSGN